MVRTAQKSRADRLVVHMSTYWSVALRRSKNALPVLQKQREKCSSELSTLKTHQQKHLSFEDTLARLVTVGHMKRYPQMNENLPLQTIVPESQSMSYEETFVS